MLLALMASTRVKWSALHQAEFTGKTCRYAPTWVRQRRDPAFNRAIHPVVADPRGLGPRTGVASDQS